MQKGKTFGIPLKAFILRTNVGETLAHVSQGGTHTPPTQQRHKNRNNAY